MRDSILRLRYKRLLKFLNLLPMLLTIDIMVKMTLLYFGWNTRLIEYVGGTTAIPLLFIFFSARAFQFCVFHKMFLVYAAVDLGWCTTDLLLEFSLFINKVYAVVMFISGIILFAVLGFRNRIRRAFCPLDADRVIDL